MSLVEIDAPYLAALKGTALTLRRSFDSFGAMELPSLGGHEVSLAVLTRMRTYAEVQDEIKGLLKKRYAAPAADFFVETILYYLTLYCMAKDKDLEVHSERQIFAKRGQMRPDISVWLNNKVLAIIECKTQLGWSRISWQQDFNERERRLKAECPGAKAFLLVMSEGNWEGFSRDDLKIGKQYFVLLRKGVDKKDVTEEKIRELLVNRVEELFAEILKCHTIE